MKANQLSTLIGISHQNNRAMKKCCLILSLLILVYASGYAQKKHRSQKSSAMAEQHIAIDSFPTNMMINHINGWGGMTVAVNSFPAGTDLAPLLIGLKNNSCQVPHWGYLLKGAVRLIYDDGKEVVLKEGDLFYMSPGHKAKAEEDSQILDFSPQEGFVDLVAHLEKKAAEMKK